MNTLGKALARRRHRRTVRISIDELRRLITESNERSIYLHPNPLAREIFWQRLDEVHRLVGTLPGSASMSCLDLGGGSGVLAKSCAPLFQRYVIVDLDPGDARRVCDHYGLDTVKIHEEDIFTYDPGKPYGAVIAADVLEHFVELDRVIATVARLLEPGGHLITSLPTENWIYRTGRLVIGKSKPADHYHDARTVHEHLERAGFSAVDGSWIPTLGVSLPLFAVRLWKWGGA